MGRRAALKVSILVCSYGSDEWRTRQERAYRSARQQPTEFVDSYHFTQGTLAEVRNWAARRADGDWLCFLDADDELDPGYLDAMLVAEERIRAVAGMVPLVRSYPPAALLAPAVAYVHAGVRRPPTIPNKGGWPRLNECVIGTLVPRRLFLSVGGFRDLPSLEDYDLWLRCVKAGAQIVHVPAAVYAAHVRPGGRNADQSIYETLVAEHAELFVVS